VVIIIQNKIRNEGRPRHQVLTLAVAGHKNGFLNFHLWVMEVPRLPPFLLKLRLELRAHEWPMALFQLQLL
jgi:hypothetical protein